MAWDSSSSEGHSLLVDIRHESNTEKAKHDPQHQGQQHGAWWHGIALFCFYASSVYSPAIVKRNPPQSDWDYIWWTMRFMDTGPKLSHTFCHVQSWLGYLCFEGQFPVKDKWIKWHTVVDIRGRERCSGDSRGDGRTLHWINSTLVGYFRKGEGQLVFYFTQRPKHSTVTWRVDDI